MGRGAAPEDLPAAAAVLADAFTDCPWTRWTVEPDRHGERLAALHRLILSEVALPFGWVDVGDADEIVSVAVWMPDTAVPDDVWSGSARRPPSSPGAERRPAEEAEKALAGRRHVTLASLGVLNGRQGRGVGAATLAPGLDSIRCRSSAVVRG